MEQHPLILLREEVDFQNFETVIEENKETKEKNYFLVGPTIVSESENKNGRRYPKAIVEREVKKYQTVIDEGRSAGELGHPNTPEINLERISHYIKELTPDKNIWVGKHQIATTPMGTIAKSLMDDGYKLGISTRGLGTVKDGIVGEDFRLITADLVSEPSGPGCYVEAIMENKQWIIDETGKIKEVKIDTVEEAFEELEETISEIPLREMENHMMNAIKTFMEKVQKA